MNYLKVVFQGLFILLLCIAPFSWILRDGLGPNSIESSGFSAFQKFFLTFYWGPSFIFVALALFLLKKTNATQLGN